jgi:hypothetical protein
MNREVKMKDEQLARLERRFLESLVFADRAQTAMRCFLVTHQHFAGVSDMDQYLALRDDERKALDERHEAFLTLVHYERDHGIVPEDAAVDAPVIA